MSGVVVTDTLNTTAPADKYPTHDSRLGLGGKQEVADHVAMNSIPNERRRAGMQVYTLNDDKNWMLKNVTWVGDDTDWTEVTSSVADATDAIRGKVQLAADLAGVGSTAAAPVIANVAKVYNVRDGVTVGGTLYRAVANGTTDDSVAINKVIDAAFDAGGGTVYIPPGRYMIRDNLHLRSFVTVYGVRGATILTSDQEASPDGRNMAIFKTDQTHEVYSPTIHSLTFKGTVTSQVTVPSTARSRTPGPFFAIKVNGSYAPATDDDFGDPTNGPIIRNLTIANIEVINFAALPITVFGVTGQCLIVDSLFENSTDVGFVANEEVILANCHSRNSSDNGFSMSRLNRKITMTNLTVENCALFGIWLSGYLNDLGPTEFACNGCVVIGSGKSCLNLQKGPRRGTVTGCYFYQGFNRGPIGQRGDSYIDGVTIGGGAGGVHASELIVANNVFDSPARNGISVREADNCIISNNLIKNPGTQFLANGTTLIDSDDLNNNHGICLLGPGTYKNLVIWNNSFIADGTNPYCNSPITRPNTSGTFAQNNYISATGWRRKYNALRFIDSNISGLPVSINVDGGNGSDGGDANVPFYVNLQGSEPMTVRNSTFNNQINVNNALTGKGSGGSVQAGLTMSGGDVTKTMAAVNAIRLDDAKSARLTFRALSMGIMQSNSRNFAPLYIEGSTTNRPFVGMNGGLRLSRTSITDTGTNMTYYDTIHGYNGNTSTHTETLPTAVDARGQTYILKDETGNAATYPITVVPASPVVLTFGTTDVNTTTDVITILQSIAVGTPFTLSSTGTLPGGLATSTTYYAISSTPTNSNVATANTVVNDTSIGTIAWANPSNAAGSIDTTYALFTGTSSEDLGVVYSNYLKFTNFGFAIPTSATILGMEVRVRLKATGGTVSFTYPARASVVKAGTILTTNKADTTTKLPGADTTITYGSTSELWGSTYTAANINDSTFGFAYQVSTYDGTVSVDNVSITVYYTYNTDLKVATSQANAIATTPVAIDLTSVGSGTATLTTAAQLIDGASSLIINKNNGSAALYSDGLNWQVWAGIYNTSQVPSASSLLLPVKTVYLANKSLSGTTFTSDGLSSFADGDRVLLVGQTTASENGVWIMHGGAWTRPADFSTGSSQLGCFVLIEAGTLYTATEWMMTGTTTVTVDTTSQTWQQVGGASGGGTLAVSAGGTGATTLTGILKGNGTSAITTVTAPTGALIGTTDTQTLTNKRIAKRIETLTDAATVTPNSDLYDGGKLQTLSQSTTIANPTGTPTEFQHYVLRIKSTVPQSLAWGTQYRGSVSSALPVSSTGSSQAQYYAFAWNADDSKWDFLSVAQGF